MSISLIKDKIISEDNMLELPEAVKDIYDILDDIKFFVRENEILLEYRIGEETIKLGYCTFYTNGNNSVIDEFYTANFNGIDFYDHNISLQSVSKINILKKPLPCIGKEMFKKLLEILKSKGVTSIGLTYRFDSKSIDFYKKMQTHFPDEIKSITEPLHGALLIKLT